MVRITISNDTMQLYKKIFRLKIFFKINYIRLNLKEDIPYGVLKSESSRNIIVIVSGPYIEHLGFTLNSIRRLRTLLPSSKIIYSTDSYLSSKAMTLLLNLNVEVLINEKKPFDNENRSGNLLAQITNLVSALKTIKNSENYVLRVRSDQLILNSEFVDNLMLYKEMYDKDNNRIIKLSMNSYINRTLSTSDMFMFGKVKLMLDYWDINQDSIIQSVENLLKFNFTVFPEAILDSLFFKRTYGEFPKKYSDYLELIRNQYLIVDEPYVGIVWYKEELLKDKTLGSGLRELTHLIWLKLYINDSCNDQNEYVDN